MDDKENPGTPPTGGQPGKVTPEMFTKDRVNELMQKRVERSHQAFFNRYGVKDLKELDDLFGKSKSVDELNSKIEELTKNGTDLQTRFDELSAANKDLTKKYAFASRGIKPEKQADIETYFKGKELELNENTLDEELKTHQDWCSTAGSVVSIGAEPNQAQQPSERELAGKLLGVDL